MSIVKKWRQKEFLAHIAGQVAANMDAACRFAVGQAQQRAPVDRGVLRGDIDYEVTARALVVEGVVGVKKGKAFYGYFQELGTRKMSAHPFLRPAVFDNAREIVRILTGR